MTTDTETPLRIELLSEAIRLTGGDRNELYGDPYENHAHIARVFNAISGKELSAHDIVMVQVATKLARLARNPTHNDSHIDAAAYLGILRECARLPE
tara:strand:- start:2566 stop:2856 length:291 start_codon:yes stop_codon:yes gene_type:complete